jgi:hypothetical protein
VTLLRRRSIAVLFAFLALVGLGDQIMAHAMPAAAHCSEHQHSDSEEKGGCEQCTSHCSPAIAGGGEELKAFLVPAIVAHLGNVGEKADESIPLGIDHPPQLS